ncbi:uncharacterized protein LOC6575983 [Drosophila mojavensis]|uniref:Uncharacterized protein n=1 Tax=Drosophila mojavensis TaxID=7230 RepID=B4KJ67_DROMO|nr:uncharacterized protein LOC6575983 [Drosophila mojavensis]EDW11429.2 uncharacterized protein Dmoj_GI16911 [Drosophila mojavensis]
MASKICALARSIAKHVQVKWTLQLLPLLIVLNYVQEAIQSSLQLRLEAGSMARIINSGALIGALYVVFDVCLILVGAGLILSRSKQRTAVPFLMLHRTLRCIFTANFALEDALSYSVDVGSLLLLWASRRNQEAKLNKRKWDIFLFLARVCMSFNYLSLCRAKNVISGWFSVICCICMLIGFNCRLVACLTALLVIWQACCQFNWSFIFGWNDLTISVSLICSLLGKVAGFLLMARLGAGKWSLDART